MPTPFESAQLNLQLFDLRREAVLREARQWFLIEFNPESFAEFASIVSGPRNTAFRMVLGYWEMAASLVTTGAIDAQAFLAAHGEIVGTFSKKNGGTLDIKFPRFAGGRAVLTSFTFTFTKTGYASARCPAKTLTVKSVFTYAASGSAGAPTQSPSATIKCEQR